MTTRFPKLWLYGLVFGIMANFGLAFHQYILFVRAYFTQNKAITLYIDVYHEANTELVMLTVAILVGAVVTVHLLKCIRNEKCIYSQIDSEQEREND